MVEGEEGEGRFMAANLFLTFAVEVLRDAETAGGSRDVAA
jgi:hypothetical protein